jgi:predicted DNA-binding transcriptional regulator AlpA
LKLSQSHFLTQKELCQRWKISRATLFRGEREGRFPSRIQMGGRRVAYLTSDVLRQEQQWLEKREERKMQQGNQPMRNAKETSSC